MWLKITDHARDWFFGQKKNILLWVISIFLKKNQPLNLSQSSAISLCHFSYFCYFWPKGKKSGQKFWVKILPLPRWISMEKFRYLAPFIWLWEPYVTFCDGRTDKQTNRQTDRQAQYIIGYICIHIHVYIFIHIHIYSYIYIYVYIYLYIHMSMYVRICLCICAWEYICIHISIHRYMCVCARAHICVYICT